MKKFKSNYKNWKLKLDVNDIIEEMYSYENFKTKKKLFFRN